MRDAFGGAFMLKLALVFIIIYISFMAMALNYAKAFRVKNGVINIIEQYQLSSKNDTTTIDKIDEYLVSVGYNFNNNTALINYCKNQDDSQNKSEYIYTTNGACIIPRTREGTTDSYYEVLTFIHIQLPFLGINMPIPIKGETKIIYG